PFNLTARISALAVLLMQPENVGARINLLARGRWAGRLWRGGPRLQEVIEERNHTLSIPSGSGGVKMLGPGEKGVTHPASPPPLAPALGRFLLHPPQKMWAAPQPRDPPGISTNLPPVRHHSIERATAAGDRRGRACRPRRRSGRRKALAVTFCRWD